MPHFFSAEISIRAFGSVSDFSRRKSQIIGADQLIMDAVHPALNGPLLSGTVKVSVITLPHPVGAEQFRDLPADIAVAVTGRLVKETELLPLPARFQ